MNETNTTPAILEPIKSERQRLAEYLDDLQGSFTVGFYDVKKEKVNNCDATHCIHSINSFFADHQEFLEGLARLKGLLKAEMLKDGNK